MDERGIVNLKRNITIKYIMGKCNFISTSKNLTIDTLLSLGLKKEKHLIYKI